MPINHISKHTELTDNQFMLIGKLTIEFSNIEFLLSSVLGRLLITPSFLSRTFTERMNVMALTKKIRNALDIHERRYRNLIVSSDLIEQIKIKLSEIENIRLIRNKFAHNCWSRQSDTKIYGTEFLGKQPNRNKPDEGIILLTNNEIEETYKDAYRIVEDFNNILNQLPELLEKDLRKKLNKNNAV